MNKIIDEILDNYNQFNQVKKHIKTQNIHNHQFHIESKYQIIDKVGRGSYSIVVAAIWKDTQYLKNHSNEKQKQQDSKRIIAIKKMENIFVHKTYTKKALRQLRSHRLFKHPNILQLHTIQLPLNKDDFFEIYCIFEMMDTNLQKVLQKSQQDLNQEHWKFFLYQILRGLKYLHSAGVIHSNISTKSCLVNELCDLKLCQLSQISLMCNQKRFQILEEDFSRIYYPAPELLLKDHQFTTAIDIWSAGCVFAQIINRKPFFHKSNIMLEIYCDYIGNPEQKNHHNLSSQGKFLLKKLQKHKRQPKDFNKLFPLLSQNGVDLMKKMLIFNKESRITAQQALRHPYFKQLHNQQFQPNLQQKQDLILQFQFQNFSNLSTQDYRKLLFQEILLYHSSPLKNQYSKKLKRKESLMNHILKKQSESSQKAETLNKYIEDLVDDGIKQQEKLFHHNNPSHLVNKYSRKKSM